MQVFSTEFILLCIVLTFLTQKSAWNHNYVQIQRQKNPLSGKGGLVILFCHNESTKLKFAKAAQNV